MTPQSSNPEFVEGEEYDLDELPENDMLRSGKLESLGDGRLAARYGDTYVEFEWSKVECVDVKERDGQ